METIYPIDDGAHIQLILRLICINLGPLKWEGTLRAEREAPTVAAPDVAGRSNKWRFVRRLQGVCVCVCTRVVGNRVISRPGDRDRKIWSYRAVDKHSTRQWRSHSKTGCCCRHVLEVGLSLFVLRRTCRRRNPRSFSRTS